MKLAKELRGARVPCIFMSSPFTYYCHAPLSAASPTNQHRRRVADWLVGPST